MGVVTVAAAHVKPTKKKTNVKQTSALKKPVLSGKDKTELVAKLSKPSLVVHATAVTAPRLYTNAEAPSSRVINTATTTTTSNHATGMVVIAVIWTRILLSSSYIARTASAYPNGVKPKRACRLPKYQGDKYCDDANNVPSCNWDGGDCCAKDGKHVETKYCRDCLCKDPNHKGSRCLDGHKKDGFCDDVNNVPECNYDDGDCCNNGHSGQFRYCKECECKDKTHHKKGAQCQGKCGSTKHKGDKFCDDDNNSCGCGWDGGDCCGHNGNNNQFEFCFKCKCLDSKFKAPDCAVAKYKGDGICDDHNNVKKCDWDGGDCCKQSKPNPKQFHYCKRCKCDHKKY